MLRDGLVAIRRDDEEDRNMKCRWKRRGGWRKGGRGKEKEGWEEEG